MSQETEQLYKNKLIAALASSIAAGNISTTKIIAGTPGISLTRNEFYLATVSASLLGKDVDYAIYNQRVLRADDDTARLSKYLTYDNSYSYELRWVDPEQCPYQSLQSLVSTASSTGLVEQFSKGAEITDVADPVKGSVFFNPLSKTGPDSGGKKTQQNKVSTPISS